MGLKLIQSKLKSKFISSLPSWTLSNKDMTAFTHSPKNVGLLDPETSDGRVIFFLPWEGKTIAGTTDAPCEVTFSPAPQEKEVQFILNEIKKYLNPDVQGEL